MANQITKTTKTYPVGHPMNADYGPQQVPLQPSQQMPTSRRPNGAGGINKAGSKTKSRMLQK